MKLPNKTFCVLPWISLEATPMGTTRPCCMYEEEISKETGNPYNLNHSRLVHIQHSKHMEYLREDFLAGNKPEACRKCWDEEAAGRTSKRQNTQQRLATILKDETEWTTEPKELMFLDLKLGNICNLKCRICGPWSSSQCATEEIKHSTQTAYAKEMNAKGQWPRKEGPFWTELDFLSDKIRYLEFTGGEPFMIKEHFKYLETLVAKKLAPDIEIHYNTNGTHWPESYIHIWEHFKHVEIAFSIDNVGDRFNYERANAKWDNVVQNLNKFIDLRDGTGNVSLQLCTTINIYNVLYLEDIANWEYFDKFDYVYWNMLHEAPENCIKALPQNVKDYVCDELLMADVDDATFEEFKNITVFMDGNNGVTKEKLLEKIERLDCRRGVCLKDTHPELYELLYD